MSRRSRTRAFSLASMQSVCHPASEPIANGWMLESTREGEYWLIARDAEQGYTKRALLFSNRAEAVAWAEAYSPED